MIDCDQHLFEPRTLWRDHADPGRRDLAIGMVEDEAGYTHLAWKGRRIALAHVPVPGDTDAVGRIHAEAREGKKAAARYDDLVPAAYVDPGARLSELDRMGIDGAVLFPNYGLTWERVLRSDLEATRVNMGSWNRYAIGVAAAGGGRLHPVAHLTLRDVDWLEGQLAALSSGGVRLAMISPGLVDGRPLSHPDLERAWAAFVEHGVTPVFHVANVERPFADAWYTDAIDPLNQEERQDIILTSVFLWTGAALALADLTLNGVFQRHPDLRIGIMELSAPWVPLFLMYLDGGVHFTTRLTGTQLPLDGAPSDAIRSHVRIAAFSYERPDMLAQRSGDLFMGCSDWPHSEGTATPLADYGAMDSKSGTKTLPDGLLSQNVSWLLRR